MQRSTVQKDLLVLFSVLFVFAAGLATLKWYDLKTNKIGDLSHTIYTKYIHR